MWEAIKDHRDNITFYPLDEDVVTFIDRAVSIMHKRNMTGEKAGRDRDE